jgi:peptide/nickel transport system permease protein
MTSDSGSNQVRLILVERLPHTLLLWGVADLLVFFVSVFLALALSRRYGSLVDRLSVALAPVSTPPIWFYGILLILLFASALRVLPYGGFVDAPPPPTTLGYALSVAKHMVLPVLSVFIALIFSSLYSWRTFFLIYSSEDYVEMAKAKGLSSRAIERRYILRPTLPPIVTSFSMMMISLWMGGIVTETVFAWPGLGRLLYDAIQHVDTPVIVGSNVIYGYLLAITVLLLDFAYAALDPRVRLGGTRRS